MEFFIYFIIPGERPLFPLVEKIDADTAESAFARFSKLYPEYLIDGILILDEDEGKFMPVTIDPHN